MVTKVLCTSYLLSYGAMYIVIAVCLPILYPIYNILYRKENDKSTVFMIGINITNKGTLILTFK